MRSFALAALWVVASIGAVTIAWAGVGVVNSEVIAPPPATVGPLGSAGGAADLGAENGSGDNGSADATSSTVDTDDTDSDQSATTASTTVEASTSSPQSASSSTTSAEDSPATTTAPGASPSTTVPDTASTTTVPSAGSSTSTTSTTVPTSTTVTTSTTVPTASGSCTTTQTLTFPLVGGTAAFSFSPSGVEFVWAVATVTNPPFTLKGPESQPPGLKIEFVSDTHRSRLDVWCGADGLPAHDIREREL